MKRKYWKSVAILVCILTLMMSLLPLPAFASEYETTESNEDGIILTSRSTEPSAWEALPVDVLDGIRLVAEAGRLGEAEPDPSSVLTQFIPVCAGMEVNLPASDIGTWIAYSDTFMPERILWDGRRMQAGGNAFTVLIPEDVSYIRGSGLKAEITAGIRVRSLALYMLQCGYGKPDLSDFVEVEQLTLNAHTRKLKNGSFDTDTWDTPSIGDLFFTPKGTEIVVSFRNENIAPVIYTGDNFNSTRQWSGTVERIYGYGEVYYRWKTEDVCNWLGACFEATGGHVRILTLDELREADPHVYIRFPGKVTGTENAALIRTRGLSGNYKRLFTVMHLTDLHGDMDSTHAAFEYADQIEADFVALTGDYVPYASYQGYNILHTLIRNAKAPVVYSVGNHDVASNDATTYERNIMPIIDELKADSGHPWYYRDIICENELIRVISLYPFADQAEKRTRGYYTAEQLAWLCEALDTVPDNGHIFILRHFSHHRPVHISDDKTRFYDYDSESEKGISFWLNMDRDPIPEIVDAFNSRSAIHTSFTGRLKDGTETVIVDYDFSGRPDSEFVAYFTGHWHCDCIGLTRGTSTRQVELCSIGTVGVKGNSGYSAYTSLKNPRDYGTDSQIAFNVFSFDFEKKMVYVARVGNGLGKAREKTWMEFSYK